MPRLGPGPRVVGSSRPRAVCFWNEPGPRCGGPAAWLYPSPAACWSCTTRLAISSFTFVSIIGMMTIVPTSRGILGLARGNTGKPHRLPQLTCWRSRRKGHCWHKGPASHRPREHRHVHLAPGESKKKGNFFPVWRLVPTVLPRLASNS